MGRRALLALVPALLAVAPPSAPAAPALPAFDSCSQLLGYARDHAAQMVDRGFVPTMPPRPLPTPVVAPRPADDAAAGGEKTTVAPVAASAPAAAAPESATDVSGTNVQEEGVDEPDTVKTDGKLIFAVAQGVLRIVDARAATPALVASLPLAEGGGHELLLRGDRLLVLQNAYLDAGPVARLTEVDVSDPAAPRVVRSERVDGSYVTARLTGATARIVVSSSARAFAAVAQRNAAGTVATPSPPGTSVSSGAPVPTVAPAPAPAALDDQAALVREQPLSRWRPRTFVRTPGSARTSLRPAVACKQVRHPVRFGGVDMLTVLTVDMDKGLPAVDTDGLMTAADVVYGSPTKLYVATRAWLSPAQMDDQGAPPPPLTTTIHAFDVSKPGETTYLGSGGVGGYLLNQFSLSEDKGVLRAATTTEPVWWNGAQQGEGESAVTTLSVGDGGLKVLGEVGGLGKGERIYAVRFVGDAGYVVTFRQVDPLYVVDLSDPAAPRLRGELKLAGYSAYLHPLGDGLLLGVGQAAGDTGRTTGTQLSLFDVSDPASPKVLAQRAADPATHSDVEYDHRAFLWWGATKLAMVPVTSYGPDGSFSGAAIGYRVQRTGIDEVARVTQPGDAAHTPITRTTIVGDRVFSLSDAGLLASALGDLVPGQFVPFP